MTKYYVNSADGKDCVYEGYDEAEALKIWHNYNGACGDWYLDEEEIEATELFKMETETGDYLIDEDIDMNYIHGNIEIGRDVTVYRAIVPDDMDEEDESIEWEWYDDYKA